MLSESDRPMNRHVAYSPPWDSHQCTLTAHHILHTNGIIRTPANLCPLVCVVPSPVKKIKQAKLQQRIAANPATTSCTLNFVLGVIIFNRDSNKIKSHHMIHDSKILTIYFISIVRSHIIVLLFSSNLSLQILLAFSLSDWDSVKKVSNFLFLDPARAYSVFNRLERFRFVCFWLSVHRLWCV